MAGSFKWKCFFFCFVLFFALQSPHICCQRKESHHHHHHHGQHPFQMALPIHVSGHSAGCDGTALPRWLPEEGVLLHPHFSQAGHFVRSKRHNPGHAWRGRLCRPLTSVQISEPWWWDAILSQEISFNKWVLFYLLNDKIPSFHPSSTAYLEW